MTTLHLAQLNIGRIRYSLDDPRMADFVNNLDRVNAIAEHTPGFVWRLQDDSGNATAIHAFDDPRMLLNMSVWEWFEPLDRPHFVLWRVPAGHLPDVAEAKGRLEHLWAHGPSDYAFGWESVPSAQLWKTARCA